MLAVIALLCAVGLIGGAGKVAAQDSPLGVFRVEPTSGAIGSVVTVSGDFDRDITRVRFSCLYRELGEQGFDVVRELAIPSPRFTFEYTIPAELNVRQYTDVPRRPPGGECEFLAEAGHQLLTARVEFTVTESAAAMPSAGLRNAADGTPGRSIVAVLLAAGAIALVSLAWWARKFT